MECKYIKYYKEPKTDYVCLSTSLFLPDKYIKQTKNLNNYNALKNKSDLFYKNILKMINNLKKYPDNWFYRLYFNKSIFKLKKFKELILILSKNKRVQLVQYECKDDFNLFGTLIRFYPIFEKSKTMKYCLIIDADNFYTDKFVEIFKSFKKSNKLVLTVNKINQISFHSQDYNTDYSLFNFIYLLGGLIMIKKDKIFEEYYWNRYFTNFFKQQDLLNQLNYLDFKKYAINPVIGQNLIDHKSYRSFDYGTDELWINFVIKKILKEHKKTKYLDCYFTKDFDYNFLKKRLLVFLKYNYKINREQFNLFLNEFSMTYSELNKYIKKNKFNKVFDKFSDNKYLDRLYIQNNIKFILLNYKKLLKIRGNYKYYDITHS